MKKIALAGNPNVGKSTLFNALTKMHQHTGNWPGKTVSNAKGKYKYKNEIYEIYDLPGTYSLLAHSKEEEVARNAICFGNFDAIVVVCDATCLQKSLNLALQVMEITNNVIICVNLLDEAAKKKIKINLNALSNILNVPVVGISASREKKFDIIFKQLDHLNIPSKVTYSQDIEDIINYILPDIESKTKSLNPRWVCLNLFNNDYELNNSLKKYLSYDLYNDKIIKRKIWEIHDHVDYDIKEKIASENIKKCEEIVNKVVVSNQINLRDKKIDRILTNKWSGIPIMVAMLAIIFYITINGANYPSQLLFNLFKNIEQKLNAINYFSPWLKGILVDGVYHVVTWVISVMLPPMAIFFPLFTLCEDLGLLPRIAFNFDGFFEKCNACGKQALTMGMGFGCNAVGVEGTRIIDSARERLIAILTNVFVPCNGRFPIIISIITMFFKTTGLFSNLLSTIILTIIIIFGIFITFIISKILSKTILKGIPSSFVLELPPYRKPQVIKVIIRSIFDRTMFVLGRAIVVSAPMGAIIWLLANTNVGSNSLLITISQFLNPLGNALGMDGIILLGFILGFPANEIVMPIILMCYLKTNNLINLDAIYALKNVLINNGWTIKTAICVIVFTLCHFPCSTTCLTIKKETGSIKWSFVAFIIPTVVGMFICAVINILCILLK